MEVESFQVNHLHDYEIAYELITRRTKTSRNLNDQRKILRRLLAKEVNRQGALLDLGSYIFDFAKEQREIEKTFYDITEATIDFADNGEESDSLFSRIKSRIAHVTGRVLNLNKFLGIPDIIQDDQKDQVKTYYEESFATCLKLEADLYDSIKVPNPNASVLNVSQTAPVINVAAPIVTCSGNSIPISEWNVRFDGNSKHLYSFLERVTELAQARKVSENDLFNSAVELFVGDAFAWFRCNKTKVTNWEELVILLKKDFLHFDAEDQIWDSIRQRKQKKTETVSIFIAHMQTFMNRLSHTPAEVTKVRLIKQNLLPEYITQLALTETNTVSELLEYCKKLEEANYIKNKHRSSEVSEIKEQSRPSTSFSNNQGHKYKNFNRNKNFQNKFSNNSNKIQFNKVNTENKNKETISATTKKSIKCWNCGLDNHSFHDCRAKRKIFCYRCGKPEVKSNNCSCSKN